MSEMWVLVLVLHSGSLKGHVVIDQVHGFTNEATCLAARKTLKRDAATVGSSCIKVKP